MKRLRKREPRAVGLLLGFTGFAMWMMMNLSGTPMRVATASPGTTPEIHSATASAFATFTVTSTADIGLNTLRQAILDANGNADPTNTINFNLPAGSTITLMTGQLPTITKDLTITGSGANNLTISGNNAMRVFVVANGVTTAISGLTIMNGAGAISNGDGTVTITNSVLSNNTTSGSGGGIRNNGGTVTITNSTLSNNSSSNGGAIANNGGTMTIINSTLSGNSSINGTGGGIVVDSGTANIINSTLIGNSALNNTGGGFRNFGTVNIKNSILNNPAGGDCSNLGTVNASGVNFSTDGTCPGFIQVTAMQLNLGPLQNNGGPTQTHALLSGSVAIDTVTDCTDIGGNPIPTDQRGVPRPIDGDSNGVLLCDAGSYEAPECTTNTPTIICPANITQSNDPSQCGAIVTYPNPTITDNCPGSFTATCIPASGSFFPVGTTTVTCSINTEQNKADAAPDGGTCLTITQSTSQLITPGNSISCNNEFGHSDNSYWRAFNLPSFAITTPFSVQSVDLGIEDALSGVGGQKGKAVRFSPSARNTRTKTPSGAGQPLTVRLYTNTGGVFPDGTRNLLATANFIISDQSGTIMNLPISANVPAGSELVVEIFTPSGEAEGNFFFIGSNSATETGPSYLSALECGVSTPTPTAELGAPNMHIVMNVNGCEAPPDSACSFSVTVQDTQAPTLTCPKDFIQSTDPNQCSAAVEYALPAATDNCPCMGTGTAVQSPDGESGCSVTCLPPPGATFPKGTTTVTCTATDASGNESMPCTFPLTVNDTQPPAITCPPNQTASTPDGNPVIVTYAAPTVTDNCSLSCPNNLTTPQGECPTGSVTCTPPSGSTFNAGTTTVTCSACDCAGNSASCSFSVTVEPCTITCPANISRANDPNQCGAAVTFAPDATAGCGTVTCSPASGSFFLIGTTTVTCTTSAGPGCTFTVTVNDTQAPVITCPVNITALTPACGSSTSVATYPTPTTTDNCPKVTTVCNPPSGSILPIGTTTVTCTATDASGNSATCSFTVSLFNACLQDDNNPSIVLLWNTQTGAYRFCCNGTIFTGVGKVLNQGDNHSISHSTVDRRVNGVLDCAASRGQGGLQSNAGSLICTINDRDIRNNSCSCGMPGNSATK